MALFGEIGDDGDDDETYREKGSDEENEDEDSEDYRGRGVHQRGDINILLCGDPGTYVVMVAVCVHTDRYQCSVYTSVECIPLITMMNIPVFCLSSRHVKIPITLLCTQDHATRNIHQWKGFVCCGTYSIRNSGS